MPTERIQVIEQHVRTTMSRVVAPDLKLAHDFKHVDRVRHWALHIADAEGDLDREIVEATALLHDIGLAYVETRAQHAPVGADAAAQFLRDQQLFADHQIRAIADAIRCHSSLSGGGKLGAVLRDADMLDLFGAVGLMRACTSHYSNPEYDPANIKGDTWQAHADDFTARFRSGLGVGTHIIDQINFQLSCYNNLHTATAKHLAEPLVAWLRSFVVQLEHEISTGQRHA